MKWVSYVVLTESLLWGCSQDVSWSCNHLRLDWAIGFSKLTHTSVVGRLQFLKMWAFQDRIIRNMTPAFRLEHIIPEKESKQEATKPFMTYRFQRRILSLLFYSDYYTGHSWNQCARGLSRAVNSRRWGPLWTTEVSDHRQYMSQGLVRHTKPLRIM